MIRVNSPGCTSTTEQIGLALGKAAEKVIQGRPAHWDFSLTNGRVLKATAELDEGWLLMHAHLLASKRHVLADADQLWNLLRSNATLSGGAKYALDPDGLLGVRAEIPLGEEVDLCGWASAVCQGFKMASERVSRKEWSPTKTVLAETAIANDSPAETSCDLQRLCRDLNWAFTERTSGSLVVELDVPNSFYQATIEQRPSGVHLWVNLENVASAPSLSRKAVGILLLTASRVVRMARATALGRDDNTLAAFEVVLNSCPAAVEIHHALSALSMACRLCAQEADILQDESIAKQFLRLRGWSS